MDTPKVRTGLGKSDCPGSQGGSGKRGLHWKVRAPSFYPDLRAEQMYKRFPRNLGETVTSILSVRWGLRDNNSRLSKACSQLWEERTMRIRMVLPSEGNEVRWDAITVVVVSS